MLQTFGTLLLCTVVGIPYLHADDEVGDTTPLDTLIAELQTAATKLDVDAAYEAIIQTALAPPSPEPPPEPPPQRPTAATPAPQINTGWLQEETAVPSTPAPLHTDVLLREDFAIRTPPQPIEVMVGPTPKPSDSVIHLLCKGASDEVAVRFEGRWMSAGRAGAVTTTYGAGIYLKDVEHEGEHLVWAFGQILDRGDRLNVYVKQDSVWKCTHTIRCIEP
ncbi:MAG: hypothetical protein HQ523_06370 [Lentisphaerae bacterium]|nr:hypothetical protein [Lentisphaerota bacterium]